MYQKINRLAFLLLIIAFPANAYAQPKIDGIVDIIYRAIDLAFLVSGFVAVIMVISAGYMWMMSAGDPQKTQAAQGAITWSIIGIVFLFLLRALIQPVIDFLTK